MKHIVSLIAFALVSSTSMFANAEPYPEDVDDASWDGVWAPEPSGPGGPGGRHGPGARGGPEAAGGGSGQILRLGGPPPRQGGQFGGDPRFEISEEDAAKGLERGDMAVRRVMTPAGRAKFDEFDPLELPSANCQTSGLPGIAVIPELQEWRVSDDAVVIRHESYDVKRVVDLSGAATASGVAHTVLGTASGSLDGDTLVIETTNLSAGWGGLSRNAPGSDQRSVRETYHMVDHDTIEGEIVIRDPVYLTRDVRIPVVLKRQPADVTIESFPCDVEVARRHLQAD